MKKGDACQGRKGGFGKVEPDYTVWRSAFGWMGLVGSTQGIRRIYLPMSKKEELYERVKKDFPGGEKEGDIYAREIEEIEGYFNGQRKEFTFALDFSKATAFQKRVYEILLTIPFGQIRTYAWVAKKVGNAKALRAVGNANGKNQWPLAVPCHRVVGSNGELTGFSASGGLDLKARLLRHEGISVEKNRVIPCLPSDALF
jgi:methylated-DNA-[protein]-cysteine S-methyltransferase